VQIARAAPTFNTARALQFLFLTGLRRDEVLALPWTNVDLDAGAITIAADRMKGVRSWRPFGWHLASPFLLVGAACPAQKQGTTRKVTGWWQGVTLRSSRNHRAIWLRLFTSFDAVETVESAQISGSPFASARPCVLSENHPWEAGLAALSRALFTHLRKMLVR